MQEIMAEVNGRYNLSNILDVLDKLRSNNLLLKQGAKRIDIDMYDKVYKQIITESRNDGDKWYQRYIPLKPKQLKELNSLNFSFDVKTSCDENNPNQTNRIQPSRLDKVQKFTSPTTFASPPTFETRASRLTDFQSDYQKELTNQILQQISDGKRRSAQSDYIKSEKQHRTNRTISSFNINSLQQLISVVQRKIMQHYRLAFNKIIFLYNEPVKLLQDVEIQAEPSKVAKFSLKDSFQIEKDIQLFQQNQILKILFHHFDNLKQNWLRKKRIKNSRNQVLLMRKHNYLWRAFNKMRKYSIKHKQNRLKKVQSDHFYSLNQLRVYFEKWINFHFAKQNKNSKNKISFGLIQLKNQETLKTCFMKFKLYYQHRRDKHQNNLLAYGLYQQKLQKLYFTLWNNLVMNQQKRETNQFVMKKCFKKWNQYLRLKDFNRKQKQTADNLLIYQNKRKILRILRCFHTVIQNKNNYKKQLNDVYLFQLLRKGFKGFAINIQIKEKKNEQYQQIGRFLQMLYISKPFNILQQYTKEQKMKKELNSKARAIYKVNKLRRLTNFWLNWAKEKRFHRKQDIANIPQIKQFQIYLYFNKYRLAFQRSLWLKNLVRIMRSKHQKEFVKELKLNNIRFKQENKYPLKLKQKVIRGLRINLINHLKKQQFYKQLLSLHQHNIVKHIFDYMKVRAYNFRQKVINKRSVQRSLFGKYVAGPFYFWLNYGQKHSYQRNIRNNFDKLHVIKVYQKVFKTLNDYKWKKKIQKVQDQKNLPIIVYKQKLRFLKFWNAKRLSKGKIESFCVSFTNLQQRIFFKHMQLIKVRDFQKKKYMAQGRIFYLMKFAFNQLNKYKMKKLKQRNNTEIIKKRQLYHLKSNSFKHMRRLFTFEQNVAYLTAITVLQIKKNLLQKYFKGFKDLIVHKKRPRDQVMKMNKLRKCFAGWKVFTSKQQGAKLMISAIQDIQRDQKLKLFKKLDSNNRIENAKIFYKQNLIKKVLLHWFDSTQSSQKTIYLTKILNKLRLLLNNRSVQVKNNSINLMKRKILKMWASKLQKLKKFQRFLLQMENKGKDNMIFSIQAIIDNNKEIEIQDKQQNQFLFKYFQQWKKQYQKSHSLKTIIFSIENAIKKTKSCVLNRMKKINKDMKVYKLCSKMQKQRIFHKWVKQLNQIGGFNKLQNIFEKKENEQFYKKARKLFVINKQYTLNSNLSKSKLSRLFQRWEYLSKMNLKLKQFQSKLENILTNKIYYQHCQSVLFYHLQSYQIKQLKGEFALKTFNKLVQNKQYAIFGHLQQDSIYYNYLEQKNIRKQIICLTLWAKLTNESVAYKFICKSLGEIYKRNMYYNLKIIKQFGDKNQTIFKQIDDKKKQKILLFWFFQSQKRIAAKSIYNILDQNYDSKQNKMQYVVKFMEILSQNQMKTEKANKYYDIFNSLIKQKMKQAFKKVLKSSKQQYLSKCKKRKLQKQYLKQWRINKAVITFNKILGISYERNLSNYFNKVKSQIKNKKAELHYQSRLKYQLLLILQQVKNNTNKKLEYLSSKQNNNLVNVYFQMWIIELLKRTNQRKQFMKIFRGFYLYHYRTIGAEFIKQLKLEKKLQIKSEQETQHSLMYSVFQAWRMEVDQKKMLKKYLQQCSVEEKRGKSIPKYMPY
ncbi:unnamed protein product (macronuclear) [Paramecium tetraurelia]|uniref:Sfi1 spindle body domain-containing protein n=1 Tax=Paramecium tetraurelia TaxID=5888 RepID=A0BRR9_PARTE|nr:uncharacterized protein GSPATT00031467001 [Paramecium tetraurelia]CAK61236.1 unnamed protein product [Paramecium tetraurelia]|eukprot:XP_001428634.1 hypothetical protein (macronuclear) [Paramecium tetraurelia strain d4-2]